MKRTILITGGVAVLLVGAVGALSLYFISRMEREINRKKTEKARETRLANLRGEPSNFDELNELANEKSQ